MSEESDKEGREHEASEKKVADALEKGDTPRSRDVSLLGSLLGIQIALVVLDRLAVREIGSRLSILFDQSSDIRLRNGAMSRRCCRPSAARSAMRSIWPPWRWSGYPLLLALGRNARESSGGAFGSTGHGSR